jgi:mono/diheme cytochrome c family protein
MPSLLSPSARRRRACCAAAVTLSVACTPVSTTPPASPAAVMPHVVSEGPGTLLEPIASLGPIGPRPAQRSGPDDARGGRLYDDWRAEKRLTQSFVPDVSSSPELDGHGGPNSNGTLNDGHGHPLPNTGHEYRLKNLFGWDLRGAEGIYGSGFQSKPFVLTRNLLSDARSADELRAWLTEGDETTPAYGQVLNEADIDDVVAYLIKTRSGQLARPSSIFAHEASAPKHYVLAAGGDAARGRERYAISCADCHGDDGRNMVIDETESLGSMSRSNAYEVWFKMLNGQPGTDMRRQILVSSGEDQERAILDVLAALCDRTQFPAMGGAADVPDTDPRCASYLK